jgi:hypothetical protein
VAIATPTPESNNRTFADITLTPVSRLVFSNDLSIIVQNAFPAIPLPNLAGVFQRRNRFYADTASATLHLVPAWNVGLGYSYQQNNLTTYMAFQNDSAAGYVLDQPLVPYKQITQAYWGESSYTIKQRLGLNLRITYDSARSGFRPDLNPSDPAAFGNAALIAQSTFRSGAVPAGAGEPAIGSHAGFAGDRSAMDWPIQGLLRIPQEI